MEVINAIGRRKSAVARVYVTEGTGKITINKKDIETFFPSAILRYVVKQPLQLLDAEGKYDIKVNIHSLVRYCSVKWEYRAATLLSMAVPSPPTAVTAVPASEAVPVIT